jgi:hypothetical protein
MQLLAAAGPNAPVSEVGTIMTALQVVISDGIMVCVAMRSSCSGEVTDEGTAGFLLSVRSGDVGLYGTVAGRLSCYLSFSMHLPFVSGSLNIYLVEHALINSSQ